MEQATEELAHSLEELANGVAAHAERRIQIVGARGKDDLFVAAGGALAFGVDAGSMLLHNFAAVFADDLMSAVAVVLIGPVVAHVVALGLLCTAGDADAILVVAGDVCGNNCTAVSADNVVSAVAVVHIGPVVAHVIAGVLSTAGAGALAVLTVNTLSSFRHNCTAVSADDLVSAVAVVLVLEGAVVALMTAASAGGLALIVDVSLSVDHSIAVLADIRAGAIMVVHSVLIHMVANGLLSAAASTLGFTIVVDVSLSVDHSITYIADVRAGAVAIVTSVLLAVVASRHRCVAGITETIGIVIEASNIQRNGFATIVADHIVGAVAQSLKAEGLAHVVAPAGVGSNLLMAAASTLGLTVIVDVSGGIDDSITCIADVRAGAVAIVTSVLLAVVAIGIRSATFRALTIHKRAGHLLFQVAIVADCLVSGAVVVAHIGHVFVETRGGRKGCRSHSKHHSTCYNKRQHTAYFFEFHKPNLLYYKNNTVYFSINAVLCCATMHGRQSTLFPETT